VVRPDGRARPARVPFVALDREHAPLTDELTQVLHRVVRNSAFVLGEEVERFEQEWAAASGTRHCVGVASGTAALTLLLRAAGIGRADEVILPAHTFIATALAVVHAGATPVLCDVDEASGLLDVAEAARLVGPRTAALLPVHLYGQLCDMEAVNALAERHGLAVFEDAAQAHGAKHQGRGAGAWSRGAAYSFYPSKNLGALGDGGAICTDDDEIAKRARRLRNLGQRRKGEHLEAGVNERLDGLQAAVLRLKLRGLDAANDLRREHAARYRALLGNRVPSLVVSSEAECVWHLFPVRVERRDEVRALMDAEGVEVGVHYSPALHEQPALRDHALTPEPLPRADAWAAEVLSLPMSPALTASEVERAATTCLDAVRACARPARSRAFAAKESSRV